MKCQYCGKVSNPLAVCNECADILHRVQKPYVDKIHDAKEKHKQELEDLKRDGREAVAYEIQRLRKQAAK